MITDKTVRQFFARFQNMLSPYWQEDVLLRTHTQFFRGVAPRLWKNSYPSNCNRHFLVFRKYNIIPEYCFDCYKISIKPRNVIELFKLMLIFEQLELPNDNTRKCLVEMRPEVSGTYAGIIFFQGLAEARESLIRIRALVAAEISDQVPVLIKRGCSEYPLAYPEYGQFGENYTPVMQYPDEWRKFENLADKNGLAAHLKPLANDTYNHPGFVLVDAWAMLCWLRYAATIGDTSYLKITGHPVRKLEKMHPRPPFRPAGDEQQ